MSPMNNTRIHTIHDKTFTTESTKNTEKEKKEE